MDKAEIKRYLEKYNEIKAIVEFKKRKGLKEDRDVVCLSAVESAIAILPNGLDQVLIKLYIQKQSLRYVGKKMYLTKDTVSRKRDKAIDMLCSCLGDL